MNLPGIAPGLIPPRPGLEREEPELGFEADIPPDGGDSAMPPDGSPAEGQVQPPEPVDKE